MGAVVTVISVQLKRVAAAEYCEGRTLGPVTSQS